MMGPLRAPIWRIVVRQLAVDTWPRKAPLDHLVRSPQRRRFSARGESPRRKRKQQPGTKAGLDRQLRGPAEGRGRDLAGKQGKAAPVPIANSI